MSDKESVRVQERLIAILPFMSFAATIPIARVEWLDAEGFKFQVPNSKCERSRVKALEPDDDGELVARIYGLARTPFFWVALGWSFRS